MKNVIKTLNIEVRKYKEYIAGQNGHIKYYKENMSHRGQLKDKIDLVKADIQAARVKMKEYQDAIKILKQHNPL